MNLDITEMVNLATVSGLFLFSFLVFAISIYRSFRKVGTQTTAIIDALNSSIKESKEVNASVNVLRNQNMQFFEFQKTAIQHHRRLYTSINCQLAKLEATLAVTDEFELNQTPAEKLTSKLGHGSASSNALPVSELIRRGRNFLPRTKAGNALLSEYLGTKFAERSSDNEDASPSIITKPHPSSKLNNSFGYSEAENLSGSNHYNEIEVANRRVSNG